ncbi:winged helix-turn-helix domain-containing protein [Dubosiella newyorkensis]|uniref:winged helix-turn-helix domain-containing protein n=1 Tax=Dubosiella newyorkensis TaxID=1862672 RepID=UPI0013017B60
MTFYHLNFQRFKGCTINTKSNRNHLSWTCPSYVLAKADPEKQEQFKENFQDVKKN